jgi:acyl-CoA thioesterase I
VSSGRERRKTQKRHGASIWTVLSAVFFGLLVGVSLLTFPAAVLPMVAVWLLCHTVLVLQEKPGWMPLLACLTVLLVKRVAWLPGMSFLLVVLGVVGLLRLVGQRKGPGLSGPLHKAALGIVWFAWLIAVIDGREAVRTSRRPVLDSERAIVCLGDSLTAYGYPDELASRLSVPVVNLGRDGISTTDGLELLPEIEELRPQAVVLELGGHDFVREHGEATCGRNLETIIERCRAVGAEVVLVEIPRGIVVDRFMGLERRLARSHDIELISDSILRRFVLLGPYAPPGMWLPREWHLSDDGLHPNVRGNELLADQVRGALVRVFGPEIGQTEQKQ